MTWEPKNKLDDEDVDVSDDDDKDRDDDKGNFFKPINQKFVDFLLGKDRELGSFFETPEDFSTL